MSAEPKEDPCLRMKQRAITEYLTGEKKTAKEIHRELVKFYGEDAARLRTVKEWANKEKEAAALRTPSGGFLVEGETTSAQNFFSQFPRLVEEPPVRSWNED